MIMRLSPLYNNKYNRYNKLIYKWLLSNANFSDLSKVHFIHKM